MTTSASKPHSHRSTYVTVAIPYVNAAPHLGYAYELVLADIHARSRRLAGDDVRFLGGTDDYSLKNVLAAEAAGLSTASFVNLNAARFEALGDPLGLSFDDYIRTSDDTRHIPSVTRIWEAATAAGDLYRRSYEGDYCVGCEQFYGFDELLDGRCPEHATPTERVSEENWFFRLSNYQDYLDDLISSDRLRIRPEPFRREALAFVRAGLDDISVSRSVERARGWGVPVPGDPTQIVYVWFDALTNYISALEFGTNDRPDTGGADLYSRWWLNGDRRIHVIGKGILRFHAVYWPAFLASAGQPPPTAIQVHPYLTVEGRKLSKSSGSVLDPVDVVERFGVDPLRWFFAREVNDLADTDFSVERLVARANDELANSIGNAANRLVTLAHKYLDGVVPRREPLPTVADLVDRVSDFIAEFDLRSATAAIAAAGDTLNAEIASTAPWKLAKDPERAGELADVLGTQIATLRVIAEALAPIVPDYASRLTAQVEPSPATENGRGRLPIPTPVFARI